MFLIGPRAADERNHNTGAGNLPVSGIEIIRGAPPLDSYPANDDHLYTEAAFHVLIRAHHGGGPCGRQNNQREEQRGPIPTPVRVENTGLHNPKVLRPLECSQIGNGHTVTDDTKSCEFSHIRGDRDISNSSSRTIRFDRPPAWRAIYCLVTGTNDRPSRPRISLPRDLTDWL